MGVKGGCLQMNTKCAGMNQQVWTPADIAEYPCPSCSTPVEVWKSDVRVTCPGCGFQIYNPRLGNVCLSWCERASECIGNKDIDGWKRSVNQSSRVGPSSDRRRHMEYVKARLAEALIHFFGKDYRRIEHAFSVMMHAEKIAQTKAQWDYEVLIASALLHDVGIKPSEQKHGYNNGFLQEKYGPFEAERILRDIGYSDEKIEKIREIIGNHHSPSRYDYIELEILKEADAIVNGQESLAEKNSTGRPSKA